jgi:hypothetical protein
MSIGLSLWKSRTPRCIIKSAEEMPSAASSAHRES